MTTASEAGALLRRLDRRRTTSWSVRTVSTRHIRTLAFGGPPAGYVGQASWRFVADGFPEIGEWTVMLGRGPRLPHGRARRRQRLLLCRRQLE